MDQFTGPAQPGTPTQPTQAEAPQTARGLISPNSISRIGGGQNLINPVTITAGGGDPGFWKALVLDVLGVASALLFGYTYHRYIIGTLSLWLPLAALLLWGTLSVLEGFLQKSYSRRFGLLFLESVALVAFFYSYYLNVLAVTAVVMLILLFWGYVAVRRNLENSIEMRFFTASGKILGKVISAAVIFMIVMYASLANQGSFFISQNGFSQFFTWAAGFVNNFYPNVPLTTSFSDFAQSIAKMQLQNDPSFQTLTSDEQTAALQQSATRIMGALSGSSGTSTVAVASEPTSNALYASIERLLAYLHDRFQGAFLGAWGLVLFLILRGIGYVFIWIVQFVALVFYEALLALGFMKIGEEPRTKEIIEF